MEIRKGNKVSFTKNLIICGLLALLLNGAQEVLTDLNITGNVTATGGLTGANLTLNGGNTSFNNYSEGFFTGTLTGVSNDPAPTQTIFYTRIGKIVVLSWTTFSGTSNATTCTITGLPSALSPVRTQEIVGFVEDVGVFQVGTVYIASSSTTITLGKSIDAAGGFTATGTKGSGDTTFSYQLN